MTANVYFGGREGVEVIRLPLTALYQKDAQPAVWIIDPKTARRCYSRECPATRKTQRRSPKE